jgi:hypothetical protein
MSKRIMDPLVPLRSQHIQTKEEVKICFHMIVRMEAFQPFQVNFVCLSCSFSCDNILTSLLLASIVHNIK